MTMTNYPLPSECVAGISPVARLVRARDLRVGDRLKYFRGVATFVITEIIEEYSAGRRFFRLKYKKGTAVVSVFALLHVEANCGNEVQKNANLESEDIQ